MDTTQPWQLVSKSFFDRRTDTPDRKGIRPQLWGHHTWETLHFITLGYPEANPSPTLRQSAYDLLFSLQHLLPCVLCREHLATIYRTVMPLTPAVVASRQAFGEYVVALRDYVKVHHVTHPVLDKYPHTFREDVEFRLLYPDEKTSFFDRHMGTILIGGLLGWTLFHLRK